MNKEVSFELAKLLKEKGFDEPCKLCVEDGDKRPLPFNCGNTIHRNSLCPYYSAPSIAEVVMWLYEKHGIWVSVQPHGNEFRYFIHNVHFTNSLRYDDLGLSTPTEAYEAAIEYALKNLL